MSGPLRQAWTFPKRPEVLIEALETKKSALVQQIDKKLEEEQLKEQSLAEYRERLRQAGVANWATAHEERVSYGSDPFRDIRGHYNRLSTMLAEVALYLAALREDQVREPDRLYKLHPEDLKWFGLSGE